MGKKEKFDDDSSGDTPKCTPSPPDADGFIKGFINGVTSFLGFGDTFNSIGGEDVTDELAKQTEKLQTITPKLIIRLAREQEKIIQEQMDTVIDTSKIAILQTQYSRKILENGTSIDKLIIVLSIALLMIVVLFFTIIR